MPKLTATNKSLIVPGPVRSIGVQSRSVTGTMPDGNRYESTLERDFMLLMQFDPEVEVYTPQPLAMQYKGTDGKVHRYTPDGLIEWRPCYFDIDSRPVLVEIKYREAFRGDWRRWRLLARAAQEYASDRGWHFKIYTEKEIRTPMLDNARFLLPYLNRAASPEVEQWVLERMADCVESTPRDVVEMLYRDKWNQASLIPVIWKLLAERRIGCDLTLPLTMQTPIYSKRG